MRLSTSTNILCERPDGSQYSLEKTLKLCREAGFDTFDMSFYEYAYDGMPFIGENWESWIDSAAECAARLGVSFYQGHAYTYDFLNPKFDGKREWQEELVLRSLKCCSKLGTKIIVMHPSRNVFSDDTEQETWQKNRAYFEKWLKIADDLGMEVAVENLYQYSGHEEKPFFYDPEEIASYINDFGDSRLGVCWDFEHGVILNQDQPRAVRILGDRLKATHVSDTVSKDFEPYMHVMPFTGVTQWKPIVEALREINYQGAFSFEAHNFTKKLPEELIPTAMKFAWEIGRYLTEIL